MALKLDSALGKAIGYTSDNFYEQGSFIWNLLDSAGYLAVMRLRPQETANRPIANLLRLAEIYGFEVRFYDFPQDIQEGLLKGGLEKVVERVGTTYLHNRRRIMIKRALASGQAVPATR